LIPPTLPQHSPCFSKIAGGCIRVSIRNIGVYEFYEKEVFWAKKNVQNEVLYKSKKVQISNILQQIIFP